MAPLPHSDGEPGPEPEQFGLFGEPEASASASPKTLGDLYRSQREARARRRAASASWSAPALGGDPAPAAASAPLKPTRIAQPEAAASDAHLPAWSAAGTLPRKEPEAAASPRPRRIWNVAELVSGVRDHLEGFYPDLWVHGEISNLRKAPSGHLYFTLKDGDAQLPAVLFRREAQLVRFRPEDGMEILLRGKVSVYEQRGQMQLIAESLEPVGAGALQIAFEQLKARLAAEGLFDADRKRPLPPFPRCVGIITSPSGAVIRDFLNVANRRHAGLDVLLYPATVQGATAVGECMAGISYFNRAGNVQVIVLARGGGSLEDLAPFNDERLARAIAASSLPVVSAIGHETDFTIADFVADLRAPTPSAAAELITAAQHRVGEQVTELSARLTRAMRYQLMLARQRWSALPQPQALAARFADRIDRREQVLDALSFRMEAAARHTLHFAASRLARCSVEAASARLRTSLGERRGLLEALRFRMEAAHAIRSQAACDRLTAAQHALSRNHPTHQLQLTRARLLSLISRLERLAPTLTHGARAQLVASDSQLRRLGAELVRSPALSANSFGKRLALLAPRLLQGAHSRLHTADRQLASLSPLAILSRGYALVFDEGGKLVKDAGRVTPQQLLHIRLAEGALDAITLGEKDQPENT